MHATRTPEDLAERSFERRTEANVETILTIVMLGPIAIGLGLLLVNWLPT